MSLTMTTIHWSSDIVSTRRTGTDDFTVTSFSVILVVSLVLINILTKTNDLRINWLLLVESDRLDVEYRLLSENSCPSEKWRSKVFESDLHHINTINQMITSQLVPYVSQQKKDYLYEMTLIAFPSLDEITQSKSFVPCVYMSVKGVRIGVFPPTCTRLSQSASISYHNKQ